MLGIWDAAESWYDESMSKPGRRIDIDRVVQILVDADEMGVNAAAKFHGVCPATVKNYRHRMERTPEITDRYVERKKLCAVDWREERLRFLRAAIRKLHELIEIAEPKQLRDVVGAIKIVGELEVVSGALVSDVERPSSDRESPPPPPVSSFAELREAAGLH